MSSNQRAFLKDCIHVVVEVAKVGGRACAILRESACVKALCTLLDAGDASVVCGAAEVLSHCTLAGAILFPLLCCCCCCCSCCCC